MNETCRACVMRHVVHMNETCRACVKHLQALSLPKWVMPYMSTSHIIHISTSHVNMRQCFKRHHYLRPFFWTSRFSPLLFSGLTVFCVLFTFNLSYWIFMIVLQGRFVWFAPSSKRRQPSVSEPSKPFPSRGASQQHKSCQTRRLFPELFETAYHVVIGMGIFTPPLAIITPCSAATHNPTMC